MNALATIHDRHQVAVRRMQPNVEALFEENRQLKARIALFEAELEYAKEWHGRVPLPELLGLSPTTTALFEALMRYPFVSHQRFLDIRKTLAVRNMSRPARGPHSVTAVHISRIRKILPAGVQIRALYGKGYFISLPDKQMVKDWLATLGGHAQERRA